MDQGDDLRNPAIEREMALNRQVYEATKDQLRRDYAGKYVALAFGKLIGVADTYGDAVAAVQRLKPRPTHMVVFLAEEEPLFDVIDAPYKEFA